MEPGDEEVREEIAGGLVLLQVLQLVAVGLRGHGYEVMVMRSRRRNQVFWELGCTRV